MTKDGLEKLLQENKRLKEALVLREKRCDQLDKIIRRMKSDNDELRVLVNSTIAANKDLLAKLKSVRAKLPVEEMTGKKLDEMMKPPQRDVYDLE